MRHLVGIYVVLAGTVVVGLACRDALRFIVPVLVAVGVLLFLTLRERGRAGSAG